MHAHIRCMHTCKDMYISSLYLWPSACFGCTPSALNVPDVIEQEISACMHTLTQYRSFALLVISFIIITHVPLPFLATNCAQPGRWLRQRLIALRSFSRTTHLELLRTPRPWAPLTGAQIDTSLDWLMAWCRTPKTATGHPVKEVLSMHAQATSCVPWRSRQAQMCRRSPLSM